MPNPSNPIRYIGQGLQCQMQPQYALQINVQLPANVTYPAGQVLVETATLGSDSAYAGDGSASIGSPGSKAYHILAYPATTDSTGMCTNVDQWGGTSADAPVFVRGIFLCADLTGLDLQVIAAMNGRIISGNTTIGTVAMGM